jgi:hypothetical protein
LPQLSNRDVPGYDAFFDKLHKTSWIKTTHTITKYFTAQGNFTLLEYDKVRIDAEGEIRA